MAAGRADSRKQALKILGDKGKLPDDKSVLQAAAMVNKAVEAFQKSRDEIEAKITDLEGLFEKYSGTLDQYEAKIEKDDLGLDEKNKDDTKKIQQARDILCEPVNGAQKDCEDDIKSLKELARHVILMSKYKATAMSG